MQQGMQHGTGIIQPSGTTGTCGRRELLCCITVMYVLCPSEQGGPTLPMGGPSQEVEKCSSGGREANRSLAQFLKAFSKPRMRLTGSTLRKQVADKTQSLSRSQDYLRQQRLIKGSHWTPLCSANSETQQGLQVVEDHLGHTREGKIWGGCNLERCGPLIMIPFLCV